MQSIQIAIFVSILWGIGTFFYAIALKTISPYLMQLIFFIIMLLSLPIYMYLENSNSGNHFKWSYVGIIFAAVGFLLTSFGNFLLNIAVKKSENQSGIIVNISNLYSVITLLLCVYFLKEKVNQYNIVGMILMCVSMYFLTVK